MRIHPIAALAVGTVLLGASGALQAAARPAGEVVYAYGQVRAEDTGGRVRRLSKGDEVFPGDTLRTLRGRTQVRFTDGGFAALQPRTEYKIDEYEYQGAQQEEEKSYFDLLKGAVRLVTGAIGRRNPDEVRVKTAVATIGIRGSTANIISCVDGSCSAQQLEDGTYLTNWDGVWTLESGPFEGLVQKHETYYCAADSTGCKQLEGPPRQRVEVVRFAGHRDEDDRNYEQGEQRDDEGRVCDAGGACGGVTVATGLVGAEAINRSAEGFFFNELEILEDLVVAFRGGLPVGGATVEEEYGSIDIALIDLQAARQIPSPELQELLAAVDPELVNEFLTMPASVDLFQSAGSCGALACANWGAWRDGYVLEIGAFVGGGTSPSELFANLTLLEREQMYAFVFGPDPGQLPSGVQGTYDLVRSANGGPAMFPVTNASGTSTGSVTDGMLEFFFGANFGSVDMTVEMAEGSLAGNVYEISSGLQLEGGGPGFFDSGFTAVAVQGNSVCGNGCFGSLDGSFMGATASPPSHAGLAFDFEELDPVTEEFDPVAGIAAFELVESAEGPTPAAVGTVVKYAFNFDEVVNGSTFRNSFAEGFVVDGTDNVALLGSLLAFTQTGPAFPCETPTLCNFDAGTADLITDATGPGGATSNADLGAEWGRWRGNWTFDSQASGLQERGDFHYIFSTDRTPDADVASSTGTVFYSTPAGGTLPTLNADGNPVEVGTQDVFIGVSFDTGQITTMSISGDFPDSGVSFSLGTGQVPFASRFVSLSGSVSGGGCGSGCSLFGSSAFDFAGPLVTGTTGGGTETYPAGIIGSYQGNTSSIDPPITISGTYAMTPGAD